MSDIENIEIRVCVIGDEGVGKKSIVSRFKILNSSLTVEESKKDQKSASKLSDTDTFFSKKYTGREKMKLQSLVNFTKVLTISNVNIDIKFFPISSADNIEFSDKINDEDETLKDHKLKFDNMKMELERVITKQPSNPLAEVKFLFLFVVDLKKFEASFQKLQIYYDELNRFLSIDKQYYKAFIGNKVDVKSNNIDREYLNEYLHANNFNFYEISTKMFFNFEKFFEKLFFDIFESSNPSFSSKYFKEKFNYVMTLRPTFDRAERSSIKMNEFPGPQRYDANVYGIDSIKPVFGKERFNKKIFVNKQGPIFDFKNEVFLKKQNKASKSTKIFHRNPTKLKSNEERDNFETAEKKRKLKDEMFGHHPGLSLGVKPSQLRLRKERKKEYQKVTQTLEDVFDLDNITAHKQAKRSDSLNAINETKEEALHVNMRKKFHLKQRIDHFKKRREKLNPHLLQNKKSEDNQTRMHSPSEYVVSIESAKRNVRAKSQHQQRKYEKHQSLKKESFIVPGPASYDVRSNVDLTKGYSFGGRHPINSTKSNYGPGYLYLESDIDQMLKQPKFAFKKSFAPRFKDPVIQVPGDAKEIEEKLRYMEENKLNELNKNMIKMQEWERKREEALIRKEDKDEYRYRRLEDTIIKKEEKEKLKRAAKGLKPLDPGTTNYNLVEESAPMYSIKGRYEKGFMGVQENFDDPSKLHGLEQSVSYLSKNLTKNLNPLPNYNTVKSNLPSFSMPRSERFETEKNIRQPGPNSYFQYQDQLEILDRKPGSYHQAYMGTDRRFKEFEYSYIPGPGMYKLKGFSEEVLIQAEKKAKMKANRNQVELDNQEVNAMMEMIDQSEDDIGMNNKINIHEGYDDIVTGTEDRITA